MLSRSLRYNILFGLIYINILLILTACAVVNFPADMRGRTFKHPVQKYSKIKLIYDLSELKQNKIELLDTLKLTKDKLNFNQLLTEYFKKNGIDIDSSSELTLLLKPVNLYYYNHDLKGNEEKTADAEFLIELRENSTLCWAGKVSKSRDKNSYLISAGLSVQMLADCLYYIADRIPEFFCQYDFIFCHKE